MSRFGRIVNRLSPKRLIKSIANNRTMKKLNKIEFELIAVKLENKESQKSTFTVVGLMTVLDLAHKLFNEDWSVSVNLNGDSIYQLVQPE